MIKQIIEQDYNVVIPRKDLDKLVEVYQEQKAKHVARIEDGELVCFESTTKAMDDLILKQERVIETLKEQINTLNTRCDDCEQILLKIYRLLTPENRGFFKNQKLLDTIGTLIGSYSWSK